MAVAIGASTTTTTIRDGRECVRAVNTLLSSPMTRLPLLVVVVVHRKTPSLEEGGRGADKWSLSRFGWLFLSLFLARPQKPACLFACCCWCCCCFRTASSARPDSAHRGQQKSASCSKADHSIWRLLYLYVFIGCRLVNRMRPRLGLEAGGWSWGWS